MTNLESQFRSLTLEWADTHQRLRRMMGRIDKLAGLQEARERQPEETEESPELSRDDVLSLARARRAGAGVR